MVKIRVVHGFDNEHEKLKPDHHAIIKAHFVKVKETTELTKGEFSCPHFLPQQIMS